ncbi:hypothetical protein ACLMJK_008799 [Lecanora helva]
MPTRRSPRNRKKRQGNKDTVPNEFKYKRKQEKRWLQDHRKTLGASKTTLRNLDKYLNLREDEVARVASTLKGARLDQDGAAIMRRIEEERAEAKRREGTTGRVGDWWVVSSTRREEEAERGGAEVEAEVEVGGQAEALGDGEGGGDEDGGSISESMAQSPVQESQSAVEKTIKGVEQLRVS